jgi:hypothetical protein
VEWTRKRIIRRNSLPQRPGEALMDPDAALRQAAVALLASVSPITVKAVLRMLLAEFVETPATAAATVAKAKPNGGATARARPADQADPDWQTLRAQVRARREQRGLGNAELATQLGVAVGSFRSAIATTRPPSRQLMKKLAAWLDAAPPSPRSAPEVAADGSAFPGNGVGGSSRAAQGAPGG